MSIPAGDVIIGETYYLHGESGRSIVLLSRCKNITNDYWTYTYQVGDDQVSMNQCTTPWTPWYIQPAYLVLPYEITELEYL